MVINSLFFVLTCIFHTFRKKLSYAYFSDGYTSMKAAQGGKANPGSVHVIDIGYRVRNIINPSTVA